MKKEILGRILLVETPYLNDGGFIHETWHAAIDDDQKAIDEVRTASNSSSDIKITVVGRLRPSSTRLMKNGEVKSWA